MIQLKNVSKRLGDFYLKNINLTISENEYFVILGPTGTGKTVILEIIAGLYKPDTGEIYLNNRNMTCQYPEERQVSFVYQDYMLFPHLNVRENIIFGLKLRKTDNSIIEKELKGMTELLGIGHLLKRYPGTLSGGEQQRVAIARALITSPKMLLLDEPLSALDPRTKEIFQQELKLIHEKIKTTTIHITHDFNEALVLADRIGIMHQGEIIQVGTPDEIFYKPDSLFVANFTGMENIFDGQIIEDEGSKYFEVGNCRLRVVTELSGSVHAAVRPEDILLANERFTSSAQNMIQGRIKKILPQGSVFKIILEGDIPLAALITKQSLKELEFKIGKNIFAVFKTASIHVFKSA